MLPTMRILVASLFLLAGCSDPVDKAKQNYAFLKANGGTQQELCEASRGIADAYKEARDADNYRLAKTESDLDCNQASLDRL